MGAEGEPVGPVQRGRKQNPGRGNKSEHSNNPMPTSKGFGRARVMRFPELAFYPAFGFSEYFFI